MPVGLAQDITITFQHAVLAFYVRVVDQGWECDGRTSLRPMQRHDQTSQSQALALYKDLNCVAQMPVILNV